MDGVDYMQYIAPGLIMMAVITNAYANVSSSFFGAKFQRFLEEISVSPLPDWLVVLGYVGGGVLRGLLVGLVVTIISLVFTHLPVHHVLVIVAAVVLTAVVFSLAGFINGVFAKNFDQVNWIPTFILTPLTYFGGVFYSINLLPPWAQSLSHANPVLHMVNAFRYGFLGRSDVDVVLAFAIMLGAAAALFGIALTLMRRGTGLRD
jgi:ABC-2 type transport system permease protein